MSTSESEFNSKPGLGVRLRSLLLGRRLANREQGRRRIGVFEGLPAMGLDGLGSCAYGPEAALTVLMPLGAAAPGWLGWIMAPIVLLLLILFISYWQTLAAYPSNGGAYVVSRDNLGVTLSLVAAAALMVDYVLNVAVGISAGVGALVSAAPALHPHVLPLCLAILTLVTLVNLRGTLDSGRLFAIPTYIFVGSFAVILAKGVFVALTSAGHPHPVVTPPPLPPATAATGAWLLLRAFAGGCTAMTGVEAVSNGMTAFREPRVTQGRRTLTAIVAILGLMLAGVAYLASSYHIGAMDQARPGYRSVLAQLAGAVAGQGMLYYVAIGSLLCVLTLSANTSFVGFPRLCHTVAADGFLPAPFAIAGRRLVYSAGILYLALAAGVLLIAFHGITDALIPLFAIGAFMTFTLSQAGMVAHWRRRRDGRMQLWINTLGTLATGAVLIIVVIAKFTSGAWITLVVIPLVLWLLRGTKAYYQELGRNIQLAEPLRVGDTRPPVVLIVVESWNRLTCRALATALSLSREVIGVHLLQLGGPDEQAHSRSLQQQWRAYAQEPVWNAGIDPPRLLILPAQHRTLEEPVMKLARELWREDAARRVAVVIPEMVKVRWYQYLLHERRGRRLHRRLLRYADPRLAVIDVGWTTKQTPALDPS